MCLTQISIFKLLRNHRKASNNCFRLNLIERLKRAHMFGRFKELMRTRFRNEGQTSSNDPIYYPQPKVAIYRPMNSHQRQTFSPNTTLIVRNMFTTPDHVSISLIACISSMCNIESRKTKKEKISLMLENFICLHVGRKSSRKRVEKKVAIGEPSNHVSQSRQQKKREFANGMRRMFEAAKQHKLGRRRKM